MTATSSTATVSFGGAHFRHQHLCAFFSSREEEYRTLLPFMKEGIAGGEKAFHLLDPTRTEDHRARLAMAGIDVLETERSGQLELCTWGEAQLREGRFEQDRMIDLVEDVLRAGQLRFPLTRLVAQMEWALESGPAVDDLVEYESRLARLLSHLRDAVVCIYDARRFRGEMIVAMMRAHPAAVVGGVLYENPFNSPPDQLLEELKGRRARLHADG